MRDPPRRAPHTHAHEHTCLGHEQLLRAHHLHQRLQLRGREIWRENPQEERKERDVAIVRHKVDAVAAARTGPQVQVAPVGEGLGSIGPVDSRHVALQCPHRLAHLRRRLLTQGGMHLVNDAMHHIDPAVEIDVAVRDV